MARGAQGWSEALMQRWLDYLNNARECRRLAARMDGRAHRDQLIDMALHWEALAHDRAILLQLDQAAPEADLAGQAIALTRNDAAMHPPRA
jgi:hypothetical protein